MIAVQVQSRTVFQGKPIVAKATLIRFALTSLLIGSIAVIGGCSQDNDQSLTASDLAPSLQQPVTGLDRIIEFEAQDSEPNFVTETARYLGETESGIHWVATDEDENVCFITRIPDAADGHDIDAEIFGTTCATAEHFHENGIYLRVSGGAGQGNTAILLPANISITTESNATELADLIAAEAVLTSQVSAETLISLSNSEAGNFSGQAFTLTREDDSAMTFTLP